MCEADFPGPQIGFWGDGNREYALALGHRFLGEPEGGYPVTFHVSDFKFMTTYMGVTTADGSTVIYERMRRDSKLPKWIGTDPIVYPNSKVVWKDCIPFDEDIWDANGVVNNNETLYVSIKATIAKSQES